jgi:hypothetical protein
MTSSASKLLQYRAKAIDVELRLADALGDAAAESALRTQLAVYTQAATQLADLLETTRTGTVSVVTPPPVLPPSANPLLRVHRGWHMSVWSVVLAVCMCLVAYGVVAHWSSVNWMWLRSSLLAWPLSTSRASTAVGHDRTRPPSTVVSTSEADVQVVLTDCAHWLQHTNALVPSPLERLQREIARLNRRLHALNDDPRVWLCVASLAMKGFELCTRPQELIPLVKMAEDALNHLTTMLLPAVSDASTVQVRHNLADHQFQLLQFKGAEIPESELLVMLNKIVRLSPGHRRAHAWLAARLEQIGDFTLAADAVRHALLDTSYQLEFPDDRPPDNIPVAGIDLDLARALSCSLFRLKAELADWSNYEMMQHRVLAILTTQPLAMARTCLQPFQSLMMRLEPLLVYQIAYAESMHRMVQSKVLYSTLNFFTADTIPHWPESMHAASPSSGERQVRTLCFL